MEEIAFGLSPPISTLSGDSRSLIAVPSDKNSGLDKTSKVLLFLEELVISFFWLRIDFITSAVRTGKVLFSTTIVNPSAYLEISLKSLNKGLQKLEPNKKKIKEELQESWEVLAEAIQTVMRKNKISNSYDIIKKLTRGKELSKESYSNLIENLPINEVDKTKLLKLTPIQYTGLASYLAKLK